MDFKDIEELKAKLTEISKKGFIKSHRLNNTGIGKTLEDEMDIVENNYAGGDFKLNGSLVELKAQREHASSRITLTTKEPNWSVNKLETIKKVGYKDVKGRIGLKITLTATKPHPQGYELKIADGEIQVINKQLGKICFYKIDELVDIVKNKLGKNLLFVIAEVKYGKDKKQEFFHYKEAKYFSEFNEDNFKDLIKTGKVIWEFRLHIKPTGAIRDHGSGFRVSKKYLKDLFNKEETILSEEQK